MTCARSGSPGQGRLKGYRVSPSGDSGTRNLRGMCNVDRIPGPLHRGRSTPSSGDVARRLKITARWARLRKSPETFGTMETATRGRKQKQKLKEADGLGRKQRVEEAEGGAPHESDQGLGPGQRTQPEPRGSEDRPSNRGTRPGVVPAKIRKKPCLGRVFFGHRLSINLYSLQPIAGASLER